MLDTEERLLDCYSGLLISMQKAIAVKLHRNPTGRAVTLIPERDPAAL